MILISFKSLGQDTIYFSDILDKGIRVEFGYGSYSVKDEYISKEKYSGPFPYFLLGWTRQHNKYAYNLEIEYRNSDEIENNNVSINITQFSINQGFIYPFKKRQLFNNDLNLWLGPTVELFIFSNEQNIAVDGFDYARSFADLFSVGINFCAIYTLNSKFQLESRMLISALSLGFRMVDTEEDDQSPVKPLTLLSGLNSYFDLGIRYHILNRISLKAVYKFELCSIKEWTPMISASDNILVSLIYSF